MRLRISLTLAAVLAAVAALTIGVGTAGASVPSSGAPDPQTTNIPYVAWLGETVKVAKCLELGDDVSEAQANSAISDPFAVTATIEDWSGVDENNAGPATLNKPNTSVISMGRHFAICFSFEVTSQKPGMAVYKLAVSNNVAPLLLGGDVELMHQFLVIWLQDQAPVIDETPTAGDPNGDGVFNPIPDANGVNSFGYGLVHILVKGTFPLGNDFAGKNHPIVTLPDDWAWLANNFSADTSSSQTNATTAMRWDIHDDDLNTEGHVASSFCTDQIGLTEAVDNCLGGGSDPDLGPFSSIYGGTTDNAIGPFDPLRPDETLLSDGKLDAGDAPMPALQVEVSLSGDSTVGALAKADKSDIYSRDGSGSTTGATAHNLYAPFYKAYIPAVQPNSGELRSGVAGSLANNFQGFLGTGTYDYWDVFPKVTQEGSNACYDVLGNPIPVPTGNQTVEVYTDEHGEAYVKFLPDVGIKLTPDSNGRCDIYGPAPVGHATIQADSIYPDQPVQWDNLAKLSNTLAKTVNFASSKVLSCVPKSSNEAFCVEKITDLDGNPVEDAQVEFSAQAFQGSAPVIGADAAKVGGFDTTGQSSEPGPSLSFVDVWTNDLGEAGIFVRSTTGSCIDVVSENVGTRNNGDGIFRSTDFNPTSGAACGGAGTPSGGGGTPTGSQGSTGNSAGSTPAAATAPVVTAAPVAVSAPVPTAKTAPSAAAKTLTLATARVVKVGKARYLTVRVNGARKIARLHITLVGKSHGKITRRVITRYVVTNHTVRVGHLRLAKSIRSVQVALA
ncbi:MAG TPA: hypothetical protein VFB17_05225 [Gaiellaceae bacterium]|nr:hypothetical protein [Gaiellaceae bacterium]